MMSHHLKPAVAAIILLFLGCFAFTYFGVYDHFPHVDKVFHVSGGFIVAWFFAILWAKDLKNLSLFHHFVMLLGVTIIIGVGWEIFEYIVTILPADYALLHHYFPGLGLGDTLGDLVADGLGTALFMLFLL